jgi:glycosyl transferase family 25
MERLADAWWRAWRPLERRWRSNPFDAFDDIAVIHLERAPARRERFERSFRESGITSYRVLPAVDGQALDLGAMRARGDIAERPGKRQLVPGEVGCLLSHRMAWESLLASPHETMLIIEDDFTFRPGARHYLRRTLRNVPPDWAIIHFQSGTRIGSRSARNRGRVRLSPGVYRGFNESASAECYAITRRAAAYLLEQSWPVHIPADTVLGRITGTAPGNGREAGLAGYVAWPFLGISDRRESLIGKRRVRKRDLAKLDPAAAGARRSGKRRW